MSFSEIHLTREFTALVDDDDYENVIRHRWYAHFTRPERSGLVYARATIATKKVYLHRFILPTPPELQVNHINRNTLDCRKANLERVTGEENLLARVFARGKTPEEIEECLFATLTLKRAAPSI